MFNCDKDDKFKNIFVSEKVHERTQLRGNKEVHANITLLKREYQELVASAAVINRIIDSLNNAIPRPKNSCDVEKEAVLCCYFSKNFQALDCEEEVKKFIDCAKNCTKSFLESID